MIWPTIVFSISVSLGVIFVAQGIGIWRRKWL